MTKVFISYSRKDIDFARQLTDHLEKSNLEFWVDWEGIPPTVDWMKKIQSGIEESDVFLILLSPASAKSKICGEEIAHAVKSGKRLIPLVVRDLKPEEVPGELSHLNWIFFRKGDNFEESFQKLLLGINTDFEWMDIHSRLLVRALEWERGGKDRSFLLRGKDLNDAETQLAINTSKSPHPTDLHRKYILASRQASDRQRRWLTILVAVAAVVMFALAIYGFTEARRANENEQREITAKNHAEAKEFESKINQLAALAVAKVDQNFNEALLLSVEAYLHAKDNATNNLSSQGAITKILQSNPGLIQVLLGHTDWVNSMALSPDGIFLASGSWDATVILWNISNPAFPVNLKTLKEHTNSVESVAFSTDGKTLASSSYGQLILWDVSDPSNPKLLSEMKTNGDYIDLKFTQDNKILSSLKINENSVNFAVLFNVSNTKSPVELSQLESGDDSVDMFHIALSPTRNLLFSPLNNGNILEWDISDSNNPALLFSMEGDGESVESIAISADGTLLASGNSDTTIALWDITDPAVPVRLSIWSGHSFSITSLAFSSDGNTLASSSDEPNKAPIILWDISNRNIPKKIGTLNGHSLAVSSAIFNQNNEILISGSRDGTIMLWNLSNPKTDLELSSMDESSVDMAFKPKSNLLISVYSDGKFAVWDVSNVANPKKTKDLDGSINIVVFSNDGNLMASMDYENTVTIWDTKDFTKLKTISMNDEQINAIEFSTDGKTLAIIGEKIVFWDMRDPNGPVQLVTLPQEIDEMDDMVFNSDGKWMASIADQNVVLWDVSDSAKPVRLNTLEGHSNSILAMAFSPTDANLLASASADRTIILWDVTDPRNPQNINTLGDHSDWVETVSFSPDGTMLASGSDDKQLNIWNVSNPAAPVLLSKMIGHTGSINTVEFDPLGGFIASLGSDNKIIFWDINPESWVQKACALTGGDFTDIQWNQFFPSEEYRQTCEPFKVERPTGDSGEPVVPLPTAEQSGSVLPVCQDQPQSCDLPASQKLDDFCVDNNSYSLYILPVNTTFEVITPGFTCIYEEANSLGEPRISCTGPTNQDFEVSFCNASCSGTLESSNQCQAGYGLNTAQGCCAEFSSSTNNGCVTETLTLFRCE